MDDHYGVECVEWSLYDIIGAVSMFLILFSSFTDFMHSFSFIMPLSLGVERCGKDPVDSGTRWTSRAEP